MKTAAKASVQVQSSDPKVPPWQPWQKGGAAHTVHLSVLQCLPDIGANQQLTRCGYFWSSRTFVLWSLMFRYWSTECSVPDIFKSFFSSIVTCTQARVGRCRQLGTESNQNGLTSLPTRVLK